jgi:hypothetical protein
LQRHRLKGTLTAANNFTAGRAAAGIFFAKTEFCQQENFSVPAVGLRLEDFSWHMVLPSVNRDQ